MSGRSATIVWLSLLGTVIAGVYFWTLGHHSDDAMSLDAPASMPSSQPGGLRLTRAEGALKLKEAGGVERALKVGDAVALTDQVLTGFGATAELSAEGTS